MYYFYCNRCKQTLDRPVKQCPHCGIFLYGVEEASSQKASWSVFGCLFFIVITLIFTAINPALGFLFLFISIIWTIQDYIKKKMILKYWQESGYPRGGRNVVLEMATKYKKHILISCCIIIFFIIASIFIFTVSTCSFISWLSNARQDHVGGFRTADNIESYALEYMKKNNILNASETLIAYCDNTLILNASKLVILTTERVIYHEDNNTNSIALKEIEDIRFEDINKKILVKSKENISLTIIILYDKENLFYKALMNEWLKNNIVIGNKLANQEKYEDAIKYYNKSLEIDSKNIEVWYNKGLALINQKKYEDAIKCYNKILEIEPEDGFAWYNKGFILSKQGKKDDGIKCIKKAINFYNKILDQNPENIPTWVNKGNALQELGKFDIAVTCYDKALHIDPENIDAWYSKGNAYRKLGKLDIAVTCYDKALHIDPENIKNKKAKEETLKTLNK